jgi:ring-1,2-phenylacetyl-CoA epoxidase subunit PaaD
MKETIPYNPGTTEEQQVWQLLEEVKDPEVPVLSILDLGIVRQVECVPNSSPSVSGMPSKNTSIKITITPTYSGCPAMDMISMDIRLKLIEKGYRDVTILQQLSPAWTTDWMSETGKKKLEAFGIAPPNPKQQFCSSDMFREEAIACPRCHSFHTQLISQFSSTACKALYRCLNCQEAFDYFKCH